MPVYVLDLGTIFEMIVTRTKFPPRWQQLPNKPLSHRSLELVSSWYDGVVRQSLTRLKVPLSFKPMKRRFVTTP